MEHFLWTERYRPNTVEQLVLPDRIKTQFQQYVDQGEIPNLILEGPPGVGKTSAAIAMIKQLGADYLMINGSMNGNIDTLRNEIQNFASAASFTGGRKYVILDEADYLNAQSTQPALRGFMEQFAASCGFILTSNFINKIIEPLHSRCAVIAFTFTPREQADMAKAFFKRLTDIMAENQIDSKAGDLVKLIMDYQPDWRRILNEAQRGSMSGTLTVAETSADSFKQLMQFLRDKDFAGVRKWVTTESSDPARVYRYIFDNATQLFDSTNVPMVIIMIGEYQYKQAFVADGEINLTAFLVDLMHSIPLKG